MEQRSVLRAIWACYGHAPSRAPLRMTGGQMGRKRDATKTDGVAVPDYAIDADRRERHVLGGAEVDGTCFESRAIGGAGDHLRAACALEPCKPPGMIDMRMTIEQVFHVANVEAERVNIGEDLRHRQSAE